MIIETLSMPVQDSYALILAGGSGTRFWPLSRSTRPKQLLDLFGSGTMLRQAVQRALSFLPADHVLILTNPAQREETLRQTEGLLAPENVVAEPVRRDTGPAIALGIGLIAARNPQASMLVMPSDALIGDDAAFATLAQDALALSSRKAALITIGVHPSWACPSYGYVERGEQLQDAGLAHACYRVVRFCEKPDASTAQRYLEVGNFCWNAGIFVWSLPYVRKQLAAHAPQLAAFAEAVVRHAADSDFIDHEFRKQTPISIDYALMEKADEVLNFEATFEWDDIGSWISVGKRLAQDGADNASNTPLAVRDATSNIVYTSQHKQVALLGVSDLIVVDTPDALLVARKQDADRIKQIVAQLPPELT